MEKSKRKLANTMLYYVIILCIAAIITVTLFTASKKQPIPNEGGSTADTTVTSERTTEAPKPQNQTKPADTVKSSDNSSGQQSDIKAPESTKTDVEPVKITYQSPVNGYISKEYSIDIPVYSLTMNDYRAHTGIDLVCNEGSPVSASTAGIVKSVSNHPMTGTTVIIEHADGVNTYYMNLNETLPEDIVTGAKVDKGQLIGAVGATSLTEIAQEPHLHFEMTVGGAYVDPLTMLDMSTVSVFSDNAVE